MQKLINRAPRLPRQGMRIKVARKRASAVLAGIRAGGLTPIVFPGVFKTPSDIDESRA